MASNESDPLLSNLHLATTNVRNLLRASSATENDLAKMDKRFGDLLLSLSSTSREMVPLQSLAMANKTLDARINRAVSPAVKLLRSFKRVESLQRRLILLSDKPPNKNAGAGDGDGVLAHLVKYVDCVDRLNSAIDAVVKEREPVVQKLQEVVEFLSRTKAADEARIRRVREILVTLKALYETEVDALKYEGTLDEALLCLQDEYERILQHLKHRNMGESEEIDVEESDKFDLASEQEIQVLRRISESLAANDCLDICIDIFVKVRYKRAAKALMRLNPDYLRTYVPEEIDQLEWESLERAISLWIEHFELAVKRVLKSERELCNRVLSGLMDGVLWAECFVKIADKIMAVFFRFGEGVTRSSKEPQKLFKLLDLFVSLEKMKPEFSLVFEGEAGEDICSRFRELEKLLVHSSCRVFWEFGLRIEGDQDGLPPGDGSVTKLVRYAVNYLKYLASKNYRSPMARVLRTERVWKMGILSRPGTDEQVLREAVANVMEALRRNVEDKKSRFHGDGVLPHVFAMNAYWYVYMRVKGSDLGSLVGEQWLKATFKTVAEESAYRYQNKAWAPVVGCLEVEDDGQRDSREGKGGAAGTLARARLEAFLRGIEECSALHRSVYAIPDVDLRAQIGEAVVKLVVPTYASFIRSNAHVLQARSYLSTESVRQLVGQAFEGTNDTRTRFRRRDLRARLGKGGSMDGSNETFDGHPQSLSVVDQ